MSIYEICVFSRKIPMRRIFTRLSSIDFVIFMFTHSEGGAFFWSELLRSDGAGYSFYERIPCNGVRRRRDIHTNNIQFPGRHGIYEKDEPRIGKKELRDRR